MSPAAEQSGELKSAHIKEFFQTHAEQHKSWLRELHRRAELSFAEHETAKYITSTLAAHAPSLQVSRPYEKAPTAVVAVYTAPVTTQSTVLLRADMDALPITRATNTSDCLDENVHHGCGHDGHMACLLATAHYLHAVRNATRKVVLIFQPAEERGRGARAVLQGGLLSDHADISAVYALHCWPGLREGTFGVGAGPVMGASGRFAITVRGIGGHAATPGPGRSEALLAGCAIVTTGQSIVSRMVRALDSAVLAFTRVENVGCEANNVCPAVVVVRGTIRSLEDSVRQGVIEQVQRMAEGVASGYGCVAECVFLKGHPVTRNSVGGAKIAREAASKVGAVREVGLGTGMVRPSLCAEDFSEFLLERSGAYVWMGNGERSAALHTARMKFAGEAVAFGAGYFCEVLMAGDCIE